MAKTPDWLGKDISLWSSSIITLRSGDRASGELQVNPSDPPSQNLNVSLFKESQLYMSVERSQQTHRKVRKAAQEAEALGSRN